MLGVEPRLQTPEACIMPLYDIPICDVSRETLKNFILDILDTVLDKMWTIWTNWGYSGHSGHGSGQKKKIAKFI